MRLSLVVLCGAACIFYQRIVISANPAAEKQESSVSEALLGTWRLVSVETLRPNGEVIYPFYGKHPEGLASSGTMPSEERHRHPALHESHCR